MSSLDAICKRLKKKKNNKFYSNSSLLDSKDIYNEENQTMTYIKLLKMRRY